MDNTDAALLTAASNGDADSFAVFFRRHGSPVTLYGVRRCSDPDDVADLVAETFLVALQASGRYVPESDTALPWLFGIARRVLAKQRRPRAGTRRLLVKATNAHLLFTSSEEDAVAAAIDATRQAPLLEAGLATLSTNEREVIELVAYDGLTPSEVAAMLNLSPNAARLRLSRARRHLRQVLDPATGGNGGSPCVLATVSAVPGIPTCRTAGIAWRRSCAPRWWSRPLARCAFRP